MTASISCRKALVLLLAAVRLESSTSFVLPLPSHTSTSSLCSRPAGSVPTRSPAFRFSHGYHTRNARLLCTSKETTEALGKIRLEDRNVPQAHRGLHDMLYGDDEDHGATDSGESSEYLESFDGKSIYEVSQWLKDNADSKLAAVYAMVGRDEAVKFVGVSRNVVLSVAAHVANEDEDNVTSLKVRSFKFPKREKMEACKKHWIENCAFTPIGNIEGREWSTTSKDAQDAMSPAQREAYEENKLKMRKAIADPSLVDEMEQMSSEDIDRRKRLEAAVEDDDWSNVIDGQTRLTEDEKSTEDTKTSVEVPTATIISPFDSNGMPMGVGPDGMAVALSPEAVHPTSSATFESNHLEFTLENVDKVLDEVRPYLVADGGNVRVMGVDIESKIVKLALQGACGTCPSSTTTMKMGIERVLKENFPDMDGVEQVDEAGGDAMAEATVAVVEAILEPLRPAMVAMRAKVQVLSASDGDVKLSYSGHRKVAYGVEMALLDNPLIRTVEFEYLD